MTGKFHKVQDVLDTYKSAIYEQDTDKFLTLYHPDIHIFDSWNHWESKGIAAWKEHVAEWFNGLGNESVLLQVEFNDVVVQEDTAVTFVHCAVTFAARDEDLDETLRQMTNRFTFGLKKADDSWSIVHEHSSLPIDMDSGTPVYLQK